MREHICLKAEHNELFETEIEMGEHIQFGQPPGRTLAAGSGDMTVNKTPPPQELEPEASEKGRPM